MKFLTGLLVAIILSGANVAFAAESAQPQESSETSDWVKQTIKAALSGERPH